MGLDQTALVVDAQESAVLSYRHFFADVLGRDGVEAVPEADMMVGMDLHRSPAGDIEPLFRRGGEAQSFLLR